MKRVILLLIFLLSIIRLEAQNPTVAPDFTLNTPKSKVVTLSEYVKGKKLILIDFWASWCVPCRKEGQNVKAIYSDYHSKGFDVISVSMDNSADRWKTAIAQENYVWQQVSDLKAFKSPLCKEYNFQAIPCLYLIDGNMNVIAVNLRGGNLRSKVAEICK
jgi:peroxiredoxin